MAEPTAISPDRRAADQMLSHVDIVTNGFAGLLLLFILTLATQQQFAWLADQSSADTAGLRRDPFVVLVTPTNNRKLFDDLKDVPWTLPAGWSAQMEYGADYAVLYADRAPAAGQQVQLANMAGGGELDVQIFADGQPPFRERVPVPATGIMTLWPVRNAGAEP